MYRTIKPDIKPDIPALNLSDLNNSMPEFIIPDIFAMVLEYSSYEDRKAWDYVEDTGLVYDNATIYESNRHMHHRLVNITVTNSYNLPYKLPQMQTLIFANSFEQEVDLSNYPRLTTLHLGNEYDHTLNFSNSNITTLHLSSDVPERRVYSRGGHRNNSSSRYKLKQLNLTGSKITHIYTGACLNASLNIIHAPHLTHLYLNNYSGLYVNDIPALTHLYLGKYHNSLMGCLLHMNLTHLDMGSEYYQELDLSSQRRLTYLKLSDAYNHNLDLQANTNLTALHLGKSFSQRIYLSPSCRLTYLHLGQDFFRNIDNIINTIKDSLIYLNLGYKFNESLDLSQCIELKSLHLSHHFDQQLVLSSEIRELYINETYANNLDYRLGPVPPELQIHNPGLLEEFNNMQNRVTSYFNSTATLAAEDEYAARTHWYRGT